MKLRIAAVFSLVAAMGGEGVLACSCGRFASFLESATRTPLVIRGTVRSYVHPPEFRHPLAMEVEVSEVLQGSYGASTIRILGDNGRSCLPYVSNFPVETEWIFAVTGPFRARQLGDENFTFPWCSSAALAVDKGRVTGNVDGRRRVLPLDQIGELLRQQKPYRGVPPP